MNTKNKPMIDLGNGFVLPVNGTNAALARGIANPAPVVTEARVGQALDAAGQPLRGLAERVQAHPLPAPKPFDYNAVQRRRREARLAERIAHDPAYRTRVKGMVEDAERDAKEREWDDCCLSQDDVWTDLAYSWMPGNIFHHDT